MIRENQEDVGRQDTTFEDNLWAALPVEETPQRSPNGVKPAHRDESTMTQLDLVLDYHRRGWVVIDLPYGRKEPGRNDWQFERHDEDGLKRLFSSGQRNVSVLPGVVSDNFLDLDFDHLLLAHNARGRLPETGLVFGRPGKPESHRVYRSDLLPKSKKFTDPIPKAKGGMGTIGEFRTSSTQQTVLPNSMHPSGEIVRWTRYEEPAEVNGKELFETYALLCAETLLEYHWPGSGRHDAALALAGGLVRAGWDDDRVIYLIEHLCRDTARPGEIAAVVADTVRKLADGEAVTGWPTLEEHVPPLVVRDFKRWAGVQGAEKRPAFTDFGNGERFVRRHGQDVLYCAPWEQWLAWTGTHWQIDQLGLVMEWGKETIRAIPDETKGEADSAKRTQILGWGIKSEQGFRLETMLRRARSVEGIAIVPGDLDNNPWLLNVANGTVDLRKMELREHRREDSITKIMPVAYLPEAQCPLWCDFISTAMKGNQNLIRYLQRLVGYSLTGDISEKMLPLLWGLSDTGKTTFTELLLALFGEDYGMTTPESTIAAKQNRDAIPNDVARLRAARVVVVSETAEGLYLNEGRIKAMTGRNAIPARFLNKEWFTFIPEFKLFIETNHKPIIKGTDTAIWNRVKLIPFQNVVPVEQQDRRLPDKLREELPGILNWALAGCADWQKGGLQEPDEVRVATAEYREDSDVLSEFLLERCTVQEGVKVRSGDLHRAYVAWAKDRGMGPLGDQRFSDAMRERGYRKDEYKGYGTWFGIKLEPLRVELLGKEVAGNGMGKN